MKQIIEWVDPFNPFNSWKALCWAERFEAILAEDYLPPVVVNLDVTSRCQYRCVHCHHRRKQIRDRTLPDLDDRLVRTFPEFVSRWEKNGAKPRACCIVGSRGDALLYPSLARLLENLHFAGIEVGLVTNGYGWTDELIESAVHYCKFVGFSMDAGNETSYFQVHCPPEGAWCRVVQNFKDVGNAFNQAGRHCDLAWKFLILPQSYATLYEGCKLAKKLGARWVQIRPADLSESERQAIDVLEVERQVGRAMEDLNEPGSFEIVGIRHKFTSDLKKKLPHYCWLTALTATITSDGKVWPCVDRRCDKSTMLADCGDGSGWSALREVWGSSKHMKIVHNIINCGGSGPICGIRCSNYGYAELFDRVFLADDMDKTLI